MSTVEHLRQTQTDIRLIAGKLGEVNAEQKNDHRRTAPGDSHEKVEAWRPIKATYEKRRAFLKQRLNDLEEERGELERKLNQTPVSKASLGKIISQLTDVEARFAADGPADAWDALSAFIDWLERDEARVSIEEQVAKGELKAA